MWGFTLSNWVNNTPFCKPLIENFTIFSERKDPKLFLGIRCIFNGFQNLSNHFTYQDMLNYVYFSMGNLLIEIFSPQFGIMNLKINISWMSQFPATFCPHVFLDKSCKRFNMSISNLGMKNASEKLWKILSFLFIFS